MSDSGDDTTQTDDARSGLRRYANWKVALGLSGLAVMGAGAVLAVGAGGDEDGGAVQQWAATAAPAESPSASSAPAPAPTAAAGKAMADSLRAEIAKPATDTERVASARAAATNSVKIQHPLLPQAAPVPESKLNVTELGNPDEPGRTLRLVTAKADLRGQNELAWVADAGKPVGSATCSQQVRFANQAKSAHKPNLLICWRTSATKSAYTVMVDMHGKPSRSESVAVIDR
ncbi:MAG: hypothetical protein ABW022_14515, partial [Actinoplanes sp.]